MKLGNLGVMRDVETFKIVISELTATLSSETARLDVGIFRTAISGTSAIQTFSVRLLELVGAQTLLRLVLRQDHPHV